MRSAKKWFKKQIKLLEKKEKELNDLIMASTDMVHELNNVSDYVVTEVDKKNLELRATMGEIDSKIEECKKMFEGNVVSKVVEFPKEIASKTEFINKKTTHNKKDDIKNLFNNGIDISDIAKELGIGKGEVQLILGMTERCMELAN
jgi:hypothetical protein